MQKFNYLAIIFVVLASACTRYAEYDEVNGRLSLSIENGKIASVDDVSWRVGESQRSVLSKGVEIRVDLPRLNRQLIKKLFDNYEADSWAIRVQRTGTTRGQVIGEFFVPYMSLSDSARVRGRSRSPKSVSFRLFYAAAAVSDRLMNLTCPAFNHRFKIERLQLQRTPQNHNLQVSRFRRDPVRSDIREMGYFPISINGGNNLLGRYEIQLALYSARERIYKSDFRPISNLIRIDQEVPISVPECEGFKVPPREERPQNPLENFRFGR